MIDLKATLAIAKKWRSEHSEYSGGWVMVYANQVTGWKKELVNPNTEIPGSLAVNTDGEVFVAVGGDERNGASRFERL